MSASDKNYLVAKLVTFEEVENIAILIKRKSRKSFYKEISMYHHRNDLRFTREKHERTKRLIATDPGHRFIYRLLIFPDGIALDISILSRNNTNIKMSKTRSKETKGGTKFITPFLYGQVAVPNDDCYDVANTADDTFELPATP